MRDLFTCNSLVPSLICNDHVTKKRRAMVTRIVIFKWVNNFTPAQINWNQDFGIPVFHFSGTPVARSADHE